MRYTMTVTLLALASCAIAAPLRTNLIEKNFREVESEINSLPAIDAPIMALVEHVAKENMVEDITVLPSVSMMKYTLPAECKKYRTDFEAVLVWDRDEQLNEQEIGAVAKRVHEVFPDQLQAFFLCDYGTDPDAILDE